MEEIAQNPNINRTKRDNINSKDNLNNDDFIGKIFFHKYTLIKKLGERSFGKIHSAKENSTNA